MKRRKLARLFVPQTSLLDVSDALSAIGASVDVARDALAQDHDSAAVMLDHCVSWPLETQRRQIEMVVQHLVKSRRRKKPKARRSR